MVKRKTSRVSIDALEKISKLSKDSGLTSAEIIDDALKAYGKETHTPDKDDSYNKLKKRLRAEFIKFINDSPSYLKVDNTKPPIGYIDACILSLWGKRGIEQIGEAIPAPDYEDYLRPRHDILQWVKQQLEKPIDGTSWAELHKTWYNTHKKYRGRFEVTVDNRMKALMRSKTIKPSGDRGLYIATRDFTEDEDKSIEGILSLKPQKGIVIPKII